MQKITWLCLLLTGWAMTAGYTQPTTEPIDMILDADTANEIDDLYAIARVLNEPRINLLGLNSAQWFHRLSPENSVAASQQLNEDILRITGKLDLPHPMGSKDAFGWPWGGEDPRDSPAAQFIIREARRHSPADPLYVVGIGASTNIASAIKLAPDIVPNIKVYVLGFHYDADKGVWNKDEFNIRRDLNSANYLLNTEGLELHVMPVSLAKEYVFNQEDTFGQLERHGQLGAYLRQAWLTRFPSNQTWIMWDVYLIEAMLHPDRVTEKQVTTPPENTQRQVWVYTKADQPFLLRDFWAHMDRAFGR